MQTAVKDAVEVIRERWHARKLKCNSPTRILTLRVIRVN